MKTLELKKWLNQRGGLTFLLLAVAMISSGLVCRAIAGDSYKPILYPSIFWHNNQWETYENGRWVPYHGFAKTQTAVELEPAFYPMYPPHHRSLRAHVRSERQRHDRASSSIGQPNVGLGRTTIGIGKPNVGIGQTTIGVGRPNVGVGQTTIGIGQPNTGIGQTTIGIGRTTIGIGQPNAGIGQPTVSVGQPNVGIGRTTIGIGQPMTGQHFEAQRGR